MLSRWALSNPYRTLINSLPLPYRFPGFSDRNPHSARVSLAPMITVLLIHSSAEEQERLSSALAPEEIEVTGACDIASGLQKVYEVYPDLIILAEGLMAANSEGLWLRLREVARVPVIVLGKGGDNAIRVLELGADAYLPTSVRAAVLIAWARSLLRRYRHYRFNKQELLPLASLNLTPAERRLLGCLVLNEGRLVPYSHLASVIWGGGAVSMDNLHYYVRRLKRKVTQGTISQQRGFGYRFDRELRSGRPQGEAEVVQSH